MSKFRVDVNEAEMVALYKLATGGRKLHASFGHLSIVAEPGNAWAIDALIAMRKEALTRGVAP